MLKKQILIKCALSLFCMILIIHSAERRAWATSFFKIDRPKLGAEFGYEFEEDETQGPHINRKDSSSTYNETLHLETRGYIYHPALLVYGLTLSPEWEQTFDKDESDNRKKSRSFLLGYSGDFTFLQYKPFTLTLFGDRNMTTLNSNFAQKSKSETDTYGARLLLKYQVMPTSLNYTRTESEQTGFFNSISQRDEYRLTSKYDENFGNTKIDASHLHDNQKTESNDISTQIKEISLQNYNKLSEEKGLALSSFMSYRDMNSSFAMNRGYNWSENLSWRHTKNLSTTYSGRFESFHMEDGKRRKASSIGFGLSHQLYENLTTNIGLSTEKSYFTGNKNDTYSSGVNWSYTRPVPIGRISAAVGYKYSAFDTRTATEFSQIDGEEVTLLNSDPPFLRNSDVVLSSIIVTDPSGITFYEEGIDYNIIEQDRFVRIECINSGNINGPGNACFTGADVRVRYTYANELPFDYAIFDEIYGASISFAEVFKIYYRFNRSRQSFLRGTHPAELTKNVAHVVGSSLQWKWSTSKIEYRDKWSTDLPSESWTASESLQFRPIKKIFLLASAHIGETKFIESGEKDKFTGVRAGAQLITSPSTRLSMNAFRNNNSGQSINMRNMGFSALFNWVFSIYNGGISYRFNKDEDNISNEVFKNQIVMFTVKRDLF